MKKFGFFTTILLVTIGSLVFMAVPVLACAGTQLSLSADGADSLLEVSQGDTVELVIAEHNYGNVSFTGPYVELDDGTTTVTLNKASLEFAGGDTIDNGILDPDETWMWTVSVTVDTTTTYTATGYGYYQSTLHTSPEEQDSVTVQVTDDGDGDGFGYTPGWWRHHVSLWPSAYSTGDLFDITFGVTNNADSNLTLLQAVWTRGGHEKALIRHGTAALLNAAYLGDDYHYSVDEVIDIVQDAYAGNISFNTAKNMLEQYNEL